MTSPLEPLQPSPTFPPADGPVLLIVLDGVGIGPGDEGDAVAQARTPTLDRLFARCPNTELKAHGFAVGLPSDKDMGNSEVGHNALGAGQIVAQGAKRVNQAIEDGAIFATNLWGQMVARCEAGGALHLIGLLSDGNVHSHERHVHALIRQAAEEGVQRLRLHILTDGRDVGAQTSLTYIARVEEVFASLDGVDYQIASGGGRMITTMDRYEADWSIVERGWRAHVLGDARPARSAREAIEAARAEDEDLSDQYVPPFVVTDEAGTPVGTIEDGDAALFFNFRGDRAIEICRAFDEDDFPYFDRERRPDVLFAGMTLYDGDRNIPAHYMVAPPDISRTMGEYMARSGIRQFACSETQKYGHVTYFWNGNRSGQFAPDLEHYVEVPSDNVPFEQRPWMKAAEITDVTLDAMRGSAFQFGRINLANGDMVGHTGHLEAAILSVEAVDLCLERLVDAAEETRTTLVILADHGNADNMFERDKQGAIKRDERGRTKPHTSHTLSPVPCIIFRPWADTPPSFRDDLDAPGLANVAATVLELMGFEPPAHFEPSLLARP